MFNAVSQAQKHISLSGLGVVTLAIGGYFIDSVPCQADQVTRKDPFNGYFSSFFAKMQINKVKNIKIKEGKITKGQGEYIVFHELQNGKREPLSFETFEQAYKLSLEHSPLALINSGSEKAIEECENRYELVRAKVKKLDPSLEVAFVPRTLYELVFIRKCIQEDLKHEKVCPGLQPWVHKATLEHFENNKKEFQKHLTEQEERKLKRKCWHLCYFTSKGDDNHPGLKDVAYRLNNVMVKAFNPSQEGFTHQELAVLAEKEIDFLKVHYNTSLDTIRRHIEDNTVNKVINIHTPGPTTNFGYEYPYCYVKPMGIRNETDAQIIRDAIALECSKIAENSLFLYRGSNFKIDSISCYKDESAPFSLSYGSSLFAGCMYDGGATAFYFMRNEENAYAIPVPFDRLKDSPFFVPTTHPLVQLFSEGESFHARTKAWKDFNLMEIRGISPGIDYDVRDHLRSNLTKEEAISQFKTFKSKAFQLK